MIHRQLDALSLWLTRPCCRLLASRIVFPRRVSLACLVLFMVSLVGCSSGETVEVAVDCEFIMLRAKDGILEIDRRVRRDSQAPVSLAIELRARLKGYEAQLSSCDPTHAQTLGEILGELDQIISKKPSGNAWRSARERLLTHAEALPVEATPAAAFDD
jgi:hypothetical protein